MNAQPGGTAVPMTQFALTWMVVMIAGVPMGRTAQETVSMKAGLSTMGKFGFWRMIGAPSALAR